jgi:hypothetical protein
MMHRPLAHACSTIESICRLIHAEYSHQLDLAACRALAEAILPYLARTRLPFEVAVSTIAMNYLQDGPRVEAMLGDPDAEEWQQVLGHIVAWATNHTLYPLDTEATGSPDLDAYEDIRKRLASYNFEGSLDGWITVTVVRRLYRYWRSHYMLSAGGSGYKSRAQRAGEQALGAPAPVAVRHCSLDVIDDEGNIFAEKLPAMQLSVEETVETNELLRVVDAVVADYATDRADPSLGHIWHAVVDRRLKIAEVADQLGLSIWQVYRRYESLRRVLQADQRVSSWFDLHQPGVSALAGSSQAA